MEIGHCRTPLCVVCTWRAHRPHTARPTKVIWRDCNCRYLTSLFIINRGKLTNACNIISKVRERECARCTAVSQRRQRRTHGRVGLVAVGMRPCCTKHKHFLAVRVHMGSPCARPARTRTQPLERYNLIISYRLHTRSRQKAIGNIIRRVLFHFQLFC